MGGALRAYVQHSPRRRASQLLIEHALAVDLEVSLLLHGVVQAEHVISDEALLAQLKDPPA